MLGVILLVSIWKNMSESVRPLLYFFIYSIPSNLAISLFPHEPVLVYLGATYSPIILACIVMVGTWIAGLLDYYVFVPLFTHRAVDRIKATSGYLTAVRWFSYQPFLTLIVAGFTPIPFFVFKFIAFAVKYPISKYLAALLVGRLPRYYLLALLGAVFDLPNWLIVGAFIIMLLLYALRGLPHLAKLVRETKRLTADQPQADKSQ
ncbi:MAG: VTT domain-containing protein [Deltaproteobacteria bacterium]|nr:MAG: VTT domain-containing protein [Deltaproteobacteria bacterium]